MFFFFFNDTATTEIYTLSLHDALPIFRFATWVLLRISAALKRPLLRGAGRSRTRARSEEHTSELQSRSDLVCRLLLEKKKQPSVLLTPVRNVNRSLCSAHLRRSRHKPT